MKLNLKMMLLFSAMMVAAVAILSSYSTQLNIDSFSDLSKLQFDSISHTVSEALDQQLSLNDGGGGCHPFLLFNAAQHRQLFRPVQAAV